MDRTQILVNIIGALLHKAGMRQSKWPLAELETFSRDVGVKIAVRDGAAFIEIGERDVKLASDVDILNLGRSH